MIILVADLFQEDYAGGGELTTEAIMEGCFLPIIKVKTSEINRKILDAYRNSFWIFGNFAGLSDQTMMYISQNLNYSVIEYDYKFCSYRSPEKHIAASKSCNCQLSNHGKIVSIFMASAKNVWFMSEGQRNYYCNMYPFLDKKNVRVLSSVFNERTLDYIERLGDKIEKEDVWLIQNSQSWIKGTQDSIEYAKKNNLKYEVFQNLSYFDMLAKFAKSKGFISFPKGMDTCPRTAIEAKLLGCEIICNDNVQHKDEEWFAGDKETAIKYLRERQKVFWSETLQNSNLTIPKQSDEKYKNEVHFKIIIPVYNSESWIGRAVKSVLEQEYDNYECIICDDISFDSTAKVCETLISGNGKFKLVVNSEKKFALKNIYDGIQMLNPDDQDVIVVLDGDDWLSSRFVLSNLASHYERDKCWMTYGSFAEFPTSRIGMEASEYPESVIENNSYREDRWRASHLKTFKNFLWDKIDPKDFLDDDGKFYEMTYDQAMMLPMLEMCGPKAKYVEEVNYVYNVSNPNAINKTRAQKQHNLMLKIRAKNKYQRLEDENLS